jgi:hypothetical protein
MHNKREAIAESRNLMEDTASIVFKHIANRLSTSI